MSSDGPPVEPLEPPGTISTPTKLDTSTSIAPATARRVVVRHRTGLYEIKGLASDNFPPEMVANPPVAVPCVPLLHPYRFATVDFVDILPATILYTERP